MGRRSLKTLLSQGAAGGGCGIFLQLCVIVLSHPHANNFIFVIFFPINLLIAAVIGTAIGFVIWVSERLLNRNWSVMPRMTISILCTLLLSLPFIMLLLSEPELSDVEVPWLYLLVLQVSFAIPIGMMVGSRIQPWRLIARGTTVWPMLKVVFRRGPIRISNTIQELKFSFLAGLPLRLVSLLGLMWFLLVIACFLTLFLANWRGEDWAPVAHLVDDFIECLAVTLYFAATVFVSFTLRHKWAALGVAFFLHILPAIWMIHDFGLTPHYNFLRVLLAILVSLWLPFLIGLMVLPVKKGEMRVEYGHTEIRFGKQQWVKESL